jgi:hypothetical protein
MSANLTSSGSLSLHRQSSLQGAHTGPGGREGQHRGVNTYNFFHNKSQSELNMMEPNSGNSIITGVQGKKKQGFSVTTNNFHRPGGDMSSGNNTGHNGSNNAPNQSAGTPTFASSGNHFGVEKSPVPRPFTSAGTQGGI